MCVCTSSCVHACVCAYVCVRVCMHELIHKCMCMCMCACMYVLMHELGRDQHIWIGCVVGYGVSEDAGSWVQRLIELCVQDPSWPGLKDNLPDLPPPKNTWQEQICLVGLAGRLSPPKSPPHILSISTSHPTERPGHHLEAGSHLPSPLLL
jgi:hypothetical protein